MIPTESMNLTRRKGVQFLAPNRRCQNDDEEAIFDDYVQFQRALCQMVNSEPVSPFLCILVLPF